MPITVDGVPFMKIKGSYINLIRPNELRVSRSGIYVHEKISKEYALWLSNKEEKYLVLSDDKYSLSLVYIDGNFNRSVSKKRNYNSLVCVYPSRAWKYLGEGHFNLSEITVYDIIRKFQSFPYDGRGYRIVPKPKTLY